MGAYECGATPPPAATDLLLTMTDSPDPVTLGKILAHTLPVTNLGALAADNVQLTDTLPVRAPLQDADTHHPRHGAIRRRRLQLSVRPTTQTS